MIAVIFYLVGWVIALQPKLSLAETKDFAEDNGEMVLGLTWKPTKDVLGFRIASMYGTQDVTYNCLSLVSKVTSIFDPLGFVTLVTVKIKKSAAQSRIKRAQMEQSRRHGRQKMVGIVGRFAKKVEQVCDV